MKEIKTKTSNFNVFYCVFAFLIKNFVTIDIDALKLKLNHLLKHKTNVWEFKHTNWNLKNKLTRETKEKHRTTIRLLILQTLNNLFLIRKERQRNRFRYMKESACRNNNHKRSQIKVKYLSKTKLTKKKTVL